MVAFLYFFIILHVERQHLFAARIPELGQRVDGGAAALGRRADDQRLHQRLGGVGGARLAQLLGRRLGGRMSRNSGFAS